MSDEWLRNDLEAINPRPGSSQRAADALGAELESDAARCRARRRIRRLLGVGLVGGIVAFGLTAPGQATVEWVRGVANLEENDGDSFGHRGSGDALGVGTTPEGDRYEITAFANGRERVVFNYEHDGEVEQGADVFPVSGTFTFKNGETEALPRANFFVGFLPPDVGNVEHGSIVRARAFAADDDLLATAQLSWVALHAGRLGGTGEPEALLACGSEPFWAHTCRQGVSGELRRIDRKFARPLPDEVEAALAEQGYTVSRPSDDDRELAAGIDIHRRVLSRLVRGTDGFHYERLVRVSGNGFDRQLVYLIHHFAVERHKGQTGMTTEATGYAKAPPSFTPEVATYLVDVATGKTLRTVRYGS